MSTSDKTKLTKTMLWGVVTTLLYWVLFQYADNFIRYAHTTLDACSVGGLYYNAATPELCNQRQGAFIAGHWWYVFAPIVMAFALSFTHGNFTSLFWDFIGLKPKKH